MLDGYASPRGWAPSYSRAGHGDAVNDMLGRLDARDATMADMVEAGARALWIRETAMPWDHATTRQAETYRATARVVLTAMLGVSRRATDAKEATP